MESFPNKEFWAEIPGLVQVSFGVLLFPPGGSSLSYVQLAKTCCTLVPACAQDGIKFTKNGFKNRGEASYDEL